MDTSEIRQKRIEIQGKLYDARNAYLKAKSELKFWENEIRFLKDCEQALDKPSLEDVLFGNVPEPPTGFIYGD